MDLQKVLGFGFIGLTVIFCVIGFFILPDTLVMQITISGDPGTTMSKALGLISMLALGIIGGVFVISNKEKDKMFRSYLILIILLIVDVMVFVFNL